MANPKKKEQCETMRGEKIEFIVDYDLFGFNIRGMIGIIVREDSGNGKPLVYVESADGEWLEPSCDMFVRVEPGVVCTETLKFLSRTRKLGES
jgi:ATP-dependent exoDNAse (exonuclease V) alpha subunit